MRKLTLLPKMTLSSINHLFAVGNDPLSGISRDGSEKSTSNISRAAVVLKEASSCCADVPKARYIGWWPAGLHAWWAVLWISFSLMFLHRWSDSTKSRIMHFLITFLSWIESVYKDLPISGIILTYKYYTLSLKILNWIWRGYHPYRLSPTISWNLQVLSHRTNCSHATTMINKQIRGVLNAPVNSSITLCTKTLIKLMDTVAEWPHMLLANVSISRITSPQVQANRSPKCTKSGEVTQGKLFLKYYGDRIG